MEESTGGRGFALRGFRDDFPPAAAGLALAWATAGASKARWKKGLPDFGFVTHPGRPNHPNPGVDLGRMWSHPGEQFTAGEKLTNFSWTDPASPTAGSRKRST